MTRRRGRPRLASDEASVDVHFRLTSKQYDLTQQTAAAERLTLADWIRQAIAKAHRDRKLTP